MRLIVVWIETHQVFLFQPKVRLLLQLSPRRHSVDIHTRLVAIIRKSDLELVALLRFTTVEVAALAIRNFLPDIMHQTVGVQISLSIIVFASDTVFLGPLVVNIGVRNELLIVLFQLIENHVSLQLHSAGITLRLRADGIDNLLSSVK